MSVRSALQIKVVIDFDIDHYPDFEEIQKIAEEEVLKGSFKTEVSYKLEKPKTLQEVIDS